MNNIVYVVTNGTEFLDWDDRGAMSTGDPMWSSLKGARKYATAGAAIKAAEAVKRHDNKDLWIQEIEYRRGALTPVSLPEDDPEWAEYERLKSKFKGR